MASGPLVAAPHLEIPQLRASRICVRPPRNPSLSPLGAWSRGHQGSCEGGWAGLSLSDAHSSHPSGEHSLLARAPGSSECFPCRSRGHTSRLHWRFPEPLRSRPHLLPPTPASWEGGAALRVLSTPPGTLPPRCCALLDRDVAATSISSSYFRCGLNCLPPDSYVGALTTSVTVFGRWRL